MGTKKLIAKAVKTGWSDRSNTRAFKKYKKAEGVASKKVQKVVRNKKDLNQAYSRVNKNQATVGKRLKRAEAVGRAANSSSRVVVGGAAGAAVGSKLRKKKGGK